MFKKLLFFAAAAGLGYAVASNPEARKKITRSLEQGKALLNEALENARQASKIKEEELSVKLAEENNN